jgi:hypothetical protein
MACGEMDLIWDCGTESQQLLKLKNAEHVQTDRDQDQNEANSVRLAARYDARAHECLRNARR